VSDESLQDRSDARFETRRHREKRADATVELPFNERVRVTCPECVESFATTIACGDPEAYSPTFGTCRNWECDAFLKYVSDGSEGADESSGPAQVDISQFSGGESA
jgi:hypothetical protein